MSTLALRRPSAAQPLLYVATCAAGFLLVITAAVLWRAEAALILAVPALVFVVARSRRDATTVVLVFVGFLLFSPGRFAVTQLSASFTPALAIGVGALWLWLAFRLASVPGTGGRQPLRLVGSLLMLSVGMSYAVAHTRLLSDVEDRAAQTGLLITCGALGIGLLAADGIRDRRRLEALIRFLVIGVTGVAIIGAAQFITGNDIATALRLPGLQEAPDTVGFIVRRSGFRRVSGTTSHPIEFGVLLAITLPLALYLARQASARHSPARYVWWATVLMLLLGAPFSISRSAILALFVVGIILLPTWPRRQQIRGIASVLVLTLLLRFAVPGLIGTIRSLFTNFTSDPSVGHRTGDYAFAVPFVTGSPVFGRGFHTFIPALYDFVDNQYLMSLIETGIVGLAILVTLFMVGIELARTAAHCAVEQEDRELGHALTAAICAAAVSFVTFDALSFPAVTGTTFLLIGCAGALWRMLSEAADARAAAENLPLPQLAGVAPGVSLAVVTHNNANQVEHFFAALPAALRGVSRYEVVVADNASSDGTSTRVARLAPGARVIELPANRGYAAGVNAAIAASRPSEAVLVLNPDVLLQPDSVLRLLTALRADRVGIAVPLLIDGNGRLARSLRREPTVLRALGEALLGGSRAGRFRRFGEVIEDSQRYRSAGTADWATGAAMMITRRCLADVGRWDESYFLYSEETDFCLRAREKGYALRFVPAAEAIHLGGYSHVSPRLWTILTLSRVRLFARRHGMLRSAAFIVALGLNEALRFRRAKHRAALRALLFPGRRPLRLTG